MVKPVTGFTADDGTFFIDEIEAQRYEITQAIEAHLTRLKFNPKALFKLFEDDQARRLVWRYLSLTNEEYPPEHNPQTATVDHAVPTATLDPNRADDRVRTADVFELALSGP